MPSHLWMLTWTLAACRLDQGTAQSAQSRVAACATVDTQQSTVWKDTATGENHFSLRFAIARWMPSLLVRVEWPDEVEFDNVYEAAIVDGESAPSS
jgi:hypothetical protein